MKECMNSLLEFTLYAEKIFACLAMERKRENKILHVSQNICAANFCVTSPISPNSEN